MPFGIFMEGDEHCVHKVNENGDKGKKVACHKTKKEAIAQIGAIESKLKEKEGKSIPVTNFNIYVNEPFLGETTTWGDYSTANVTWPASKTPLNTELKKMSNKMESLDERSSKVRTAFYDVFDYNNEIVEVFDNFVVAWNRREKAHYKIAYTAMEDRFEFAEPADWKNVKLKKEWVEKFINGDHLTEEDFLEEDEMELDSRYAIKSLGGGRVGGYAILWGDEENKDLHGEYFDETTADIKTVFDAMGAVPFVVHHAQADAIKSFVAGKVDVMEMDDEGVWWEAATSEFEAYRKYVKPLINEKMAFTSSGTLPAARRVNKDTGHITRWPIVEVSATWTPAEWRMLEHPITEVKSYFAELGVDAELPQFDEPTKSEPVTDEQVDHSGTEKARLKELIEQEFAKFNILEFEIQET